MSLMPPRRNQPNKRPNNPNRKPLFNMYWMYGLIVASLFILFFLQDGSTTKSVDWTDFQKTAQRGEISRIIVYPERGGAEGILTEQGVRDFKMDNELDAGEKKIKTTIPSSDKISDKIDGWNAALQAEGKPQIKVTYEKGSDLMKLF